MNQESIFFPFFGLMLLTITVWCYMYYRRLSYMFRNRVDPQSVATTRAMIDKVPERVGLPSENLVNLFELPVLFYAACLYLYVSGRVDGIYLLLAWGFFVFRVVHSAVHCTYNRVTHRFLAYILSAFLLWVIIARAMIDLAITRA